MYIFQIAAFGSNKLGQFGRKINFHLDFELSENDFAIEFDYD